MGDNAEEGAAWLGSGKFKMNERHKRRAVYEYCLPTSKTIRRSRFHPPENMLYNARARAG